MGSKTGLSDDGSNRDEQSDAWIGLAINQRTGPLPAAAIAILSMSVTLPIAAPATAMDRDAPVLFAQADERQSFSIEPQALAAALNRFSEQSGIFFAYKTGDLSGLRSPGVSGLFSTDEALRRLLVGTGVTFRFTDADTVTLERGVPQQDRSPLRASCCRGLFKTRKPAPSSSPARTWSAAAIPNCASSWNERPASRQPRA